MKLIRKISGIRGVFGETLTSEIAIRHALAFASIQKGGIILIARDTRPHGILISNAISKALINANINVCDYQIIPTPTAQFLVQQKKYSGGIVITASHNPLEWNGLKFINSDGCFLNLEENNHLFNTADKFQITSSKNNGILKVIDSGYTEHIDHTIGLSVIDNDSIKKKNFTVVIDAVNGATSNAIPNLLEKMGCKVIKIHCNPNGTFPRYPEPTPDNLYELCKSVIKNKADIGFAIDPDGDRLAIVDDRGKTLGEDSTLSICIDSLLYKNYPRPIITNLSTTMAIDKIASKYNVKVIRSAVGEINVVELMKKTNSDFGGEGNGGVILRESHLGRDAIVATAIILSWLSKHLKPLSQLRENLPQFKMVKKKINLDGNNSRLSFNNIAEHFIDITKDTTDGLKLIWDDKWVHIRKSNTEPIIRIYAEGKTEKIATNLINTIKKLI